MSEQTKKREDQCLLYIFEPPALRTPLVHFLHKCCAHATHSQQIISIVLIAFQQQMTMVALLIIAPR